MTGTLPSTRLAVTCVERMATGYVVTSWPFACGGGAGRGRAVLGRAGQCRAVLGWAGLGWAGLGWAGLGWAGLGWAVLSEALHSALLQSSDNMSNGWKINAVEITFCCGCHQLSTRDQTHVDNLRLEL